MLSDLICLPNSGSLFTDPLFSLQSPSRVRDKKKTADILTTNARGWGWGRRKKKNNICVQAKLRLSASMSSTCHQAARSSPRWRPPDLEFQATLDDNFIRLESPLEAEILVSNLYTFV